MGVDGPTRPTICLNMIVRDEAHVIEEGLASVVDHIDCWVVVDTGSVDDTIDVVRAFFAAHDVPGEVHERPWVDFGTNRTEALELAAGKADYTWVFDADDLVVGSLDLTALSADAYQLRFGSDFTWWRAQIFRSALPWRYEGVAHEYPRCLADPCRMERLEGAYHLLGRSLGGRSQTGDKFARDIEVLERAHAEDPSDPRTVFYLAQSHRDAGHPELALRFYELHISMPAWDEEQYLSRLERARCLSALGRGGPEVDDAYVAAWASRPHRLEALYDLARRHRLAGDFARGHLFASWGVDVPFPRDDLLFVAGDVHRWRLLDEASICAYYLGRVEESAAWCTRLLDEGHLPEAERARVEENLGFAVRAMAASTGASGAVPDPSPALAPSVEPRRVSLLHATHGAADDALAVRRAWLDRADRPDLVQHLFGIDSTDLETIAATDGLDRVITPCDVDRVTAVQNWNAAAAASSGELLVVIADDLYPPEGWDSTLAAIVGDLDPEVSSFAIKVRDGPGDDVLLRHPIVSRAFFAGHGLWSPDFRGLYCDDDLTLRAFWHSAIIDGSALVLDHRHPHVHADVVPSASHQRMNAEGEYAHGRSRFEAAWTAEERARPVWLVPADRFLSDEDLHRRADALRERSRAVPI